MRVDNRIEISKVPADHRELSESTASRLARAHADGEPRNYRFVAMHDFSIDRIIRLDEFSSFVAKAEGVLRQGGGLLPDSEQDVQQGGCAANAATTAARFGIPTSFVSKTNELGLHLMRYYLEPAGVDLTHVSLGGALAFASCLEVGAQRHNVMINDQHSFAPFAFADLNDEDLRLIAGADLVGVFDWSLNPAGTDLICGLLDFALENGVPVLFDTSDPAPRRDEIAEVRRRAFTHSALRHLVMNENELRHYVGIGTGVQSVAEIVEAAIALDATIPARVSVHTERFSIAIDEGRAHVVPTYRLTPRRTTGAGDTWNGGYVLATLLGLTPRERMLVANAAAGYYVGAPTATRADLSTLADFVRQNADNFSVLE